jgi:hypothetical protein
VVPETQHRETLCAKPSISAVVVVRFVSVLTAVEFDDELRGQAHEIDDVTTDGTLAPEFQPHESMRAQVIPESLFCIGLSGPQRLRAIEQCGVALSPGPSPASGRGEIGNAMITA